MASVLQEIRAALEGNISNVTGAPATSGIAWDNARFDPTDGSTWWRVHFQPLSRRPSDVTADGLKRYDGTLLVDVFTEEGRGQLAGLDNADAIIDAFDAGTILSSGSVNVETEWAEISATPLLDSPWWMTPVVIKWKSFN